jgi:hypothetical protein
MTSFAKKGTFGRDTKRTFNIIKHECSHFYWPCRAFVRDEYKASSYPEPGIKVLMKLSIRLGRVGVRTFMIHFQVVTLIENAVDNNQ